MTTPEHENTKAFAYLRVSGLTQLHGNGMDRQLEAVETYSRQNHLEIVEVFREEGRSGCTDLEGRKALPSLFVALEENGVKTVVVERLDRLARDLMIQESIVADMQKKGYTLLSALEPDLCSNDPSRILMRQIFGAIAQYDRTMIVLKLQAAKERKRLSDPAWRDGRKPYGWRDGEQEQLKLMRGLRENGAKLIQIRNSLNTQGYRARSGKPWTVGALHRILTR